MNERTKEAVTKMLGAMLLKKPEIEAGVKVFSRDGELLGHTTGKGRRCQLDGCFGWRISVKNLNGRTTFPCSKGMRRLKKGWKLL